MDESGEEIGLQKKIVEETRWEAYRTNPMFWLTDRFKEKEESFRWSLHEGYEDHKWDGDKDPLAAAWEDIATSYAETKVGKASTYRSIGIESGTGCSKTYWLSRLVLWFLDCFDNSLVVTSAPKRDQLQLGLWSEIAMLEKRIKTIRPYSQMYKLRLAINEKKRVHDTAPDEVTSSSAWHAVGFVAGTGADEQSANKARGFHRKHMLIILEECTGISEALLTAFQNTSTGYTNYIVAVGNPDSDVDTLHKFCQQKDVKNYRLSALDYPNIVMNREVYPGAVTTASISSRTDVYGKDSGLWKSMIRGISPAQSKDSLIKIEWIEQCIGIDIPMDSYNAVGVDVANSENGDKAALAWGNGNCLLHLDQFQCPNATHLAYNMIFDSGELAAKGYEDYKVSDITQYHVEPSFVGVDAVGVGVATVNAFKDEGLEITALSGGAWSEAIPKDDKGRPYYSFVSLRSQMYWQAREDLRNKELSIQVEDRVILNHLIKQLTLPKFIATNASIKVEGKEHVKQRLGGNSPDIADAFVYWNWMRHGYRVSNDTGFAAISGG